MPKKRGGGSNFKGKHGELKKHNITKRRLITILRDMGWIYLGKDKKDNHCIFGRENNKIKIPDKFKDYVAIKAVNKYVLDANDFGGLEAIGEFKLVYERYWEMGTVEFIMLSNRFSCRGEKDRLTKDCLPNPLN